MYIDTVPNRNSPPAVLLRESSRVGNKIIKRTLANLSDWPAPQVDLLRRVLKGEALLSPSQALQIERSLPHGHVAAALGTLRRIGLESDLARSACPERDLACAMIVARILFPASKLATARGLNEQTASSSLGALLGLELVDEDHLYAAMDWLLPRQARIEDQLAARHLQPATVVLYDVTSTYFEGRRCPLAQYGHSRDERPGNLQIVFGLLTNPEGCPVAVEVFEGNTADPKTVAGQIRKLRQRFELQQVVIVGDRGMLTSARIREDLQTEEGVRWITALRAPQIQQLATDGNLQLSLFDQQDLAEIQHPAYPGERLIACRNPLLAEERKRKREELLTATEKQLEKIRAATQRKRRPLRGKKEIGLAVGKVLGRYKMGKHLQLTIEEDRFDWQRKPASIEREAALDGIYVIRTSVPASDLTGQQVVATYKSLSTVERAFRSMKSVDLKVRPIHHHHPERVKAHVFLCMLAYYVEWHMRRALAPLLFDEEDHEAAETQRSSIVAPAQRSLSAQQKALSKQTGDGFPVHSFRTLLADLATLTRNRVRMGEQLFDMLATPTTLQD
ncbi:MAG TPA: IS1634 family transposase, partial [Candidatus Acidoferrum sp.]|nr:IS1634 family transposase [Candidatus Acidoferrum sp.]